jgi:hypothetical protein
MSFDVEPLSAKDIFDVDFDIGDRTRVDIHSGNEYYSTRYQADYFQAVADRLREKKPEMTDAIQYAENRAAELDRRARSLDPSGELVNRFLDFQMQQDLDRHLTDELNLRLGEDTVFDLSLSDIQIVVN